MQEPQLQTLEKTFSQMGAFFTFLNADCQGNSFLLAGEITNFSLTRAVLRHAEGGRWRED
jgi:hypothetical protein